VFAPALAAALDPTLDLALATELDPVFAIVFV
jgi:hypothetical protein